MQDALRLRLTGFLAALVLALAIPNLAFADDMDPKDLNNYTDGSVELWIGEDDFTPTKVDLGEISYWDDDNQKTVKLPSDAYTVDSSWYYNKQATTTPTREPEEQNYQIKLNPNKSKGYYGEAFVEAYVSDKHCAGNFFIDEDQDTFLFEQGETFADLSKKIKVYGSSKNAKRPRTYEKTYKLVWYKGEKSNKEDSDSYTYGKPSSLNDKITEGKYAVSIQGVGEYYGKTTEPEDQTNIEPIVVTLKQNNNIEAFKFEFNAFVLGEDSLSLDSLDASAYLKQDWYSTIPASLVLGKDYKLEGWYQDDEEGNRQMVNGLPSKAGRYDIKIIGIGKYSGTETFENVYVFDDKDLAWSPWSFYCPSLNWGMDLSLDKIGLTVSRTTNGGKTITLAYGKDYKLSWLAGSWSEEDGYPNNFSKIEGTPKDRSLYYEIEITGIGKYRGTKTVIAYLYPADTGCPHHPGLFGDDDDGEWEEEFGGEEATCTEPGFTSGERCRKCGEVLSEPQKIAPLGHDYVVVKKAVEATCDKDGSTAVKECMSCGDKIGGETIKATGHKWSTKTEQPTCGKPGKEVATCSNCGKTETKEIPATGKHSYKESVTKQPACTEDGVRTLTCSVCGDTKTEAVKATGHKWDNGTVATEATCGKAGEKAFKCTNAGCKETKTEFIPATGKHSYSDWKVVKAAAENVKGSEERTCSVCGNKETREIAALPASVKPGTTTAASGATVTVASTAPAKTPSGAKAAGTVTYKKPTNASASSVTVPATVNVQGKTYVVTQLDTNAFKNNKKVKTVKLPATITQVGSQAFSGCTALRSVSLPNVTAIGASAFKGAKSLTSVSTGRNLKTISSSAFSGAKKLKTLTVTSRSLTKGGVKGSLKGSSVKTVKVKVGSKKVNKTYVKKYKKIFTKGNAGKKASVK